MVEHEAFTTLLVNRIEPGIEEFVWFVDNRNYGEYHVTFDEMKAQKVEDTDKGSHQKKTTKLWTLSKVP